MTRGESVQDASYILFLNDTEDDYHFGCTATSRAIKAEIARIQPSLKVVSIGVREVWQEGVSERIIGLICDAVEVFVNGEGTILGYEGRVGTQNVLRLIELAEKFGKRISLINHSCFPSFSPYEIGSCEAIYQRVYSKIDSCVVRDMRSLAILNRLGIPNARLGFDCSPIYVNRLYKEAPIALAKGTYIVLGGGISFEKYFDSFLDSSAKALQETFGKKLVFLFSETKVRAVDDERCLEKIAAFNKGAKNPIEIYSAKTVDEFITVIKDAAFQITGRFHHSVIAAATGTKFLCFSTHSPKNEVFYDILSESYAPVESVRSSIVPLVKTMLAANWTKIDRSALLRLAQNNFAVGGSSATGKLADIFRLAEKKHPDVFEKYRNCHKGREMVVLASGPTLDKYKPIPGALHLGVNKVFYSGKADLDYLFMQDFIPTAQDDADAYRQGVCKKFYGAHYIVSAISDVHLEKAKAERYYFIDGGVGNSAWKCSRDISCMPLSSFSSVAHPAVQFALWTGVKRIYLVGCDTTLNGYASGMNYEDPSSNTLYIDNVFEGWRRIKAFADVCYPETEVVSINPVGLRGLFRDVYTLEYLADNGDVSANEIFGGETGTEIVAAPEEFRTRAKADGVGSRDDKSNETVSSPVKSREPSDRSCALRDEAIQVIAMRAARDEALEKVKQMRAARDEASERVVQMRAARDEALEKVKQIRAARDEALEKVKQMRAARDEASERVVQMRAARNEAQENLVRMRNARDALKKELKSANDRIRAYMDMERGLDEVLKGGLE